MPRLAILGGAPLRTKPFARWPIFGEAEKLALGEVLESGIWGGYSAKVSEFERAFAKFHDAKYAVSAANGTVTLEGAFIAAGIGLDDEVIVPAITFVATATAVLRVGAVPVFADIDEHCNLAPQRAAEAITAKTKAIVPVHFAGHPADMDALSVLAKKHGILVIEDAAHAHGASWKHQKVGTFGDVASFSFQQSKNLTAGEGGILIGNNADLISAARSFFNQGRLPGGGWYEHVQLGTNQRMTAWQAAVLLAQLQRYEEQLKLREANARYLDERLSTLPFLEVIAPDPRVTCHSRYLHVLRIRPEKLPGVDAETFTRALEAEGIPGIGRYPYPVQQNALFRNYKYRETACDRSLQICKNAFWVSHEVLLGTREDLEDFVAALSKVAAEVEELACSVLR